MLCQRGIERERFALEIACQRGPFAYIVRRTGARLGKNAIRPGAADADAIRISFNAKIESVSIAPGVLQRFQINAFLLQYLGERPEITNVSALAGILAHRLVDPAPDEPEIGPLHGQNGE